ncbi:MAG: ABC transporter permease [Phycisphaeraceae bacterium]
MTSDPGSTAPHPVREVTPSEDRGASGTSSTTAGRPLLTAVAAPAVSREHLLLQMWTVGRRSLLGFHRDGMTLAMSLLQPAVLATLVVLSQHDRDAPVYVHFFLVVSALWMGMTLTVREVVRERPLYQRDRLAGLHPDAYLIGRTVMALVPLLVQVLLLYAVARGLVAGLFDVSRREMIRDDLLGTAWWRALTVLFLAGLGGLLIGLVLSILARSERSAVAMLPLAILPQFLLSRVASGEAGYAWQDPSIFSPIVDLPAYTHAMELPLASVLLLLGSLPMVSRPATGALDLPGDAGAMLAGEWLYLSLLLLVHLLGVYLLFRSREGQVIGR